MELQSKIFSSFKRRIQLIRIFLRGPLAERSHVLGAMRPILVLCQASGFLPVTLEASYNISFSWLSLSILWQVGAITISMCLSWLNWMHQLQLEKAEALQILRNTNTTNSTVIEDGTFPDDSELSLEDMTDFWLSVYTTLGIAVAACLRRSLMLVFQLIFLVGLITARKSPDYFQRLQKCFSAVCTEAPTASKLCSSVRQYVINNIAFYILFMAVNVGYAGMTVFGGAAMENEEIKLTRILHLLCVFVYKLWYCSHVLVSVLVSTVMVTMKLLHKEINGKVEKMLVGSGSDDIEKHITPSGKLQSGLPFSKEHISQEFARKFNGLKIAFTDLQEELMHRHYFILSLFVIIEAGIAIIHLTALLTVFFNPVLVVDGIHLFQIVFHCIFLLKIIITSAALSVEVHKTEEILTKASLVNVPHRCHAEILLFAHKLLVREENTVRFIGVSFNNDFKEKIKMGISGLVIVAYFLINLGLMGNFWNFIPGESSDSQDDLSTRITVEEKYVPGMQTLSRMHKSLIKLVDNSGG